MIGAVLSQAARDLRGSVKGFRVMALALMLGVGAIATVGSFTAAVRDGIARDAKALLGGDLDLRLIHRPPSAAQLAWLAARGKLSTATRMRAMAETPGRPAGGPTRLLVELKAVDRAYPLYGAVRLSPPLALHDAVKRRGDGTYGAVAARGLTVRLGIAPGEVFRIGKARFRLMARLDQEPDRGSGLFRFGPRVIVSREALEATGLVLPGSLIRYHTRLQYPPGTDGRALEAALVAAFPDAGWRIRNTTDAAPRIRRFVERAALFFTLVGLATLLIGGVGVAGAVTGYLQSRRETIATFKCLGASGGYIFALFATEIAAIAIVAIAAGLAVGAALPLLIIPQLGALLPVAPVAGIFPLPLFVAAVYGLAVTVMFSLWPLARARAVSAAGLFRGLVTRQPFRPDIATLCALALAITVVAALTWGTAIRPRFAAWFIIGTAVAFPLFFGLGRLLQTGARWATHRLATARRPWPRLAFACANIQRPGAPAPQIVLAFGIGLTLFVALVLVEGNLRHQITSRLPVEAPAFFFIDIQPGQTAAFEKTVTTVPGARIIGRMPTLRGRIIRINDRPVSIKRVRPGTRWVVRGDRGLTYTDAMPEGTEIITGKWWPADYKGAALMSIAHKSAEGLGIGIGDRVTLNILGREVTARIANTRRVDWARLGLNFTMILTPGILEGAPHTHVATVAAPPESEDALIRAVGAGFDNITAIRVREALNSISAMLDHLAAAARATAGLALLAGVLVLAGAIAAGRRRMIHDSVILKITGCRRRDIAVAYMAEYGLAGLTAALAAAVLGTIAGFFILTRIMDQGWVFLGREVALTIIVAGIGVLVLGFLGTWHALGRKAAEILREDRL